ncbi:nuclear transport factor 2 family protein [Methylophaga sp.]|uniref:YybH family protein n=1 Tax=Methylophaga sp. TaxID=2024840 RepID=UPI00272166C4|nr:nuclear transport factor 2 family protein [Methylophaga sp.]MDO8827255.1 nuclear transport factor 2 family protein [Methylophaga sp.]
MEPKKVVEAWVEAFSKADADLISSYYSDDAINHQVANPVVSGKDAIHAMFRQEFAVAEMVCIVENIFQDGEWAILGPVYLSEPPLLETIFSSNKAEMMRCSCST